MNITHHTYLDEVANGVVIGQEQKTRYELSYVCCAGRVALLIAACVVGIALAPTVSAEPIPQVQGSSCDPNYSGACVPIASDVDCAGGSGNGPKYTDGPVIVVGNDIYGLDRDGNGTGCES